MAADEERTPGSRRVLVVDDNYEARATLEVLIQMSGYTVKTAGDGLEAFETAEAFRPHVIFMDLGMPRMDGYEAARYIRRQSWGEPMLLVAVSGWCRHQDKLRSQEAGFDMHLAKPARLNELLAILELGNGD